MQLECWFYVENKECSSIYFLCYSMVSVTVAKGVIARELKD